jgi:ParB family chromosome partitioning protein
VEELAREVASRGLSVRETEKLVRGAKGGDRPSRPVGGGPQGQTSDGDVAALENQLADLLGLTVRIAHGENGGTLTLGYATLDQLDMVCQRLTGEGI